MRSRLTDTTWVPLGVAVVALGGGGIWVGVVQWRMGFFEQGQAQIMKDVRVLRDDMTAVKALMGVKDGSRPKDDEDSEVSLSRPKNQNHSDLQRRIRDCRTSNEGDIGFPVYFGTEDDMGGRT